MTSHTTLFKNKRGQSSHTGSLFAVTLLATFAMLALSSSVTHVKAQNTLPGRIVNSTGDLQGGIIEFNTGGSNPVNLTPNTFNTECANTGGYKDAHPSVSRDGRLVAFQSTRDPNSGGKPRLFVMNSDGTNVRQLTFNVSSSEFQADQVRDFNPVISPNGGRIAFISNRSVVEHPGQQGGAKFLLRPFDIFIINADGTQLRQVTSFHFNTGGGQPGSEIVSAVWNPEGTRLAYRGRIRMDNADSTSWSASSSRTGRSKAFSKL
jgi:Tol biopolymer transport system component